MNESIDEKESLKEDHWKSFKTRKKDIFTVNPWAHLIPAFYYKI